jgi:nicotinamidase-related amidase
VPILVSEQNPRGLGPTVASVRSLADDREVVEKMHFSCLGDDGFARRWRDLDRPQTVVAGIEAHVCVLQTALDLLAAGSRVFVVADATSSRSPDNHRAALERLRADGAEIVSTEMVVFEWLVRAGTPEFRELSALIK